jgi:hypothetical protein
MKMWGEWDYSKHIHAVVSLGNNSSIREYGLDQLVDRFYPTALPKEPWLVDPMTWA